MNGAFSISALTERPHPYFPFLHPQFQLLFKSSSTTANRSIARTDHMQAYTLVHDYVNNREVARCTELYNGVKDRLEAHAAACLGAASVSIETGADSFEHYKESFGHCILASKKLNGIFGYLNRFWVVRCREEGRGDVVEFKFLYIRALRDAIFRHEVPLDANVVRAALEAWPDSASLGYVSALETTPLLPFLSATLNDAVFVHMDWLRQLASTQCTTAAQRRNSSTLCFQVMRAALNEPPALAGDVGGGGDGGGDGDGGDGGGETGAAAAAAGLVAMPTNGNAIYQAMLEEAGKVEHDVIHCTEHNLPEKWGTLNFSAVFSFREMALYLQHSRSACGARSHLGQLHFEHWSVQTHAWCTPSAKLGVLTVLLVGDACVERELFDESLPPELWTHILTFIPRYVMRCGASLRDAMRCFST